MNDLKGGSSDGLPMGRPLVALVLSILLIPLTSSAYTLTFEINDGKAWIDCENGWINLTTNGTEVANGSSYQIELDAGNITVYSPNDSACQAVFPISEELPNLRPAPSEEFSSFDTELCLQSQFANGYCAGVYLSGDLSNDSADVFAINVTGDEVLVLTLLAASANLKVELYFQNGDSETTLLKNITTIQNTSYYEDYSVVIAMNQSGRLIGVVSSQSPDTLWMLTAQRFDVTSQNLISHFDTISAYGRTPYVYNMNSAQSFLITKSSDIQGQNDIDISYRFKQNNGDWSSKQLASVGDRIRGVSETELIELVWECDCHWTSSIAKYNHYDGGLTADAPGLIPLTVNSNNSTYPLVAMDGRIISGELTLAIDDYQDILRIEVEGWNDSIHLIDVIVEGGINDLEITIIRMVQGTWEISEEISATYSMSNIETSLEVGPGTHFIRIEHINGSDSLAEDAEPVQWRMRVTTVVLDEGEQPWFPPSEEVQDAAEILRWVIGFGFLIPCLILIYHLQREKRFAKELSGKKDRLSWLRSRLDKGEIVTKDLARSLRAISSLEWEDALQAWGQPCLRHHTEGIDLAVWRLDERIVKGNTWPLLIGVNPQENTWEVAAIRFESPQGESWKVHNVDPRLLFRDHEIFLDTLQKGARFFIQIELSGSGNALDIHLSGMVYGVPFAAKPASTLYRNEEGSEE